MANRANITLTTSQAERLFDLYNNVAAADAHYQRCQSDQFRVHVKAVYQNAGVQQAFEELHALIENARAEPAQPEKVAAPRKSVLGN